MANQIFDSSAGQLGGLDPAALAKSDLEIVFPKLALDTLGFSSRVPTLAAHRPEVVRGAVQVSPTGSIQDPAGSAVGGGKPLKSGVQGRAARSILPSQI